MQLKSSIALTVLTATVVLAQAPERVYTGELLNFPGPWAYRLDDPTIILTTDEELEIMAADPGRVLNLALTHTPLNDSLQQICERAQRAGQRRIKIAFDQFFKQYRPGQDTPRRLTPDSDAYIQKIAAIGRFAARYKLGLELSLLTPLEAGPAYVKATGESGRWLHYREGVRDPVTGAFSVEMWRQRRWVNNKGPVDIEPARVRAFAFNERAVGGTPYRVVDPKSIVELKAGIAVNVYDGLIVRNGDFQAQRIRVHGAGKISQPGLDRVLVVQEYQTPEMDYFSPKALRFLENLVDRYLAAGINLQGLYSDEMHIQGDWVYFRHHDHGEFALRYVSDGLARRYAELYGSEYKDLAPYMVYFTYGQEDTSTDLSAKRGIMHVFGSSPEDIRRTALFRSRYYHLLQDGVVDLLTAAKHYAERKIGFRLDARYHATWAQSPTIDYWDVGRRNPNPYKYEYTSNFVWSNTVQQAATACYDYFKWGDFLTGNGSDHTEGGWLDRNYYALALAASIGILNEVPNAYGAHWGMPDVISNQRMNLVIAYGDGPPAFYGAGNAAIHGAVQDMEHRDVSVLMLYPMDLVAVEERFGSWMTQYGYANYVTAAKLLERGKVVDGAIEMAGRRFTTLVATFEPFPSTKLLNLMRDFITRGGRLVWSGPPPVLTAEGNSALPQWQDLFRVDYQPDQSEGLIAPGAQVRFKGALAAVTPQIVLTDLVPDHIYPVTPRMGASAVATVKGAIVGTHHLSPGGGSATFLGYRPRDDQAQSLGYDTRNWFEVLNALGGYPGASNTERISRTGAYLATRFTNGAITIAPHLRNLEESWEGGFSRNAEKDKQAMAANPPPPDIVRLREFNVGPHRVTYDGQGAVTFRVGLGGVLEGFAGNRCRAITIDGRQTAFSGKEMDEIGWAPITGTRRIPAGAVAQIWVRGSGPVSIPIKGLASTAKLYVEGVKPGSRGQEVRATIINGAVHFMVNDQSSGHFIYVVP